MGGAQEGQPPLPPGSPPGPRHVLGVAGRLGRIPCGQLQVCAPSTFTGARGAIHKLVPLATSMVGGPHDSRHASILPARQPPAPSGWPFTVFQTRAFESDWSATHRLGRLLEFNSEIQCKLVSGQQQVPRGWQQGNKAPWSLLGHLGVHGTATTNTMCL